MTACANSDISSSQSRGNSAESTPKLKHKRSLSVDLDAERGKAFGHVRTNSTFSNQPQKEPSSPVSSQGSIASSMCEPLIDLDMITLEEYKLKRRLDFSFSYNIPRVYEDMSSIFDEDSSNTSYEMHRSLRITPYACDDLHISALSLSPTIEREPEDKTPKIYEEDKLTWKEFLDNELAADSNKRVHNIRRGDHSKFAASIPKRSLKRLGRGKNFHTSSS